MSKERIADLDFEIYREPWNKYSLKDGSSIKARIILHKVLLKETLRPDGTVEKKGYGVEAQTLNVPYNVPDTLKGAPSDQTRTPAELEAAIVQDDIPYDTIAQEWNEYIVEDGTKIKLQLTMVKVARTSFFDKYGNPIYLVQNGTIPTISPKKPQLK